MTTLPAVAFADWLQREFLFAVDADSAIQSAWGDLALKTEEGSPIAYPADAATEVTAQLTFLKKRLVREVHTIKGALAGYIGQVITLTGDQLGYDGGLAVFVLGAEDDMATGLSRVTVLREL